MWLGGCNGLGPRGSALEAVHDELHESGQSEQGGEDEQDLEDDVHDFSLRDGLVSHYSDCFTREAAKT